MFNILKDIIEIIRDDKDHDVKVIVDSYGVTIELECEPMDSDNIVIPIRYETLEEIAYIPDDKYREKFNPAEYGIEYDEICLIEKIMHYLLFHKDEILDICSNYSAENRK